MELVRALLIHLKTADGKEWVDITNMPKAAHMIQQKKPVCTHLHNDSSINNARFVSYSERKKTLFMSERNLLVPGFSQRLVLSVVTYIDGRFQVCKQLSGSKLALKTMKAV